MREILFRGKRFSNGEWVIGGIMKTFHPNYNCENEEEFLSQSPNCYCICANNKDYFVEQASIGQYTGLTDKNGKKIFEGDIHERENHFFVVKYGKYRDCETNEDGYGWYFEYTHRKGCEGFGGTENEYVNIVGNIHDNPELLRTPQNDEVRE